MLIKFSRNNHKDIQKSIAKIMAFVNLMEYNSSNVYRVYDINNNSYEGNILINDGSNYHVFNELAKCYKKELSNFNLKSNKEFRYRNEAMTTKLYWSSIIFGTIFGIAMVVLGSILVVITNKKIAGILILFLSVIFLTRNTVGAIYNTFKDRKIVKKIIRLFINIPNDVECIVNDINNKLQRLIFVMELCSISNYLEDLYAKYNGNMKLYLDKNMKLTVIARKDKSKYNEIMEIEEDYIESLIDLKFALKDMDNYNRIFHDGIIDFSWIDEYVGPILLEIKDIFDHNKLNLDHNTYKLPYIETPNYESNIAEI